MKRLTILFIFGFIITADIHAQRYTAYNNGEGSTYRQDREELRDFEHEIEQLSYAMLTEHIRQARNTKRRILRDMEREINQTERALTRFNRTRYNHNGYYHYDWRTPRMHSKGNGVNQNRRNNSREYAKLVHQLEKQERLYFRFSELRLVGHRRGIINENEHRRIMYRFSETMRDELEEPRTRTNPRRGR
ncbi:MAG: hypothetical protein JJ895_10440 [Balneolaceae bacterium]|nr:hypothetical protein [Balneolaceae bacterium]